MNNYGGEDNTYGEATYGEEAYQQEEETESDLAAAEKNNEEGNGYIGEFSADYINAEIFKLFDADGSGKITKEDLQTCSKAMGWSQT